MTTNRYVLGIFSVASLLAIAACGAGGTFRVVEKTTGGGVVALPSAQDMGREKAEQYMKSQCPSGYDVQKEAEAVIGSDTTQGQQKAGFLFTAPTSSSTTTQKTEWRIEFKCKGAAPDAPADQNAKKSSRVQTVIVRY